MAFCKEVSEYYNLVIELGQSNKAGKADDKLSQEILNINSTYEKATSNANKACQYLNEYTSDIIKGRTSASAISVGKDSAPLIVSLKQLADSVYKGDITGCNMNIEEKLRNSLSTIEDNHHIQEDVRKSTSKSIQNLEYLIKNFRKQCPQEKNLSTVSEISSFWDKDVVTSSPIGVNKINLCIN